MAHALPKTHAQSVGHPELSRSFRVCRPPVPSGIAMTDPPANSKVCPANQLFGLVRGHIPFLNSARNTLACEANRSERCRVQVSYSEIGRSAKLGSMNCCSSFCAVILYRFT
jgi:hypothetical protein